MKIKAVCERTGLTDRTIRYYAEEQLISPAYTENYLGRKSFHFTESDIQQLKDIAILRKFCFSISEIKEMLTDPAQIFPTVKALQQRKQNIIDEENALLQALLQVEENRVYTVSELAAHLSNPAAKEPLPPEDSKLHIGRLFLKLVIGILVGFVTWLPVVLAVLVAAIDIHKDAYPIFDWNALWILFLVLMPSWLMLLLPKFRIRFPWSAIAKGILAVLCILSIPFSIILSSDISVRSETTDIGDYCRLDVDCPATKDSFFHELFPRWPHYFINEKQPDGSYQTVYLDAHYLYRNLPAMDYTYDIYAQWPLEKEAFDQEVSRVQELFADNYKDYITVKKGNYTCFISYDGDPPFEPVTDSYTYYIFAYDESNLTVRYILCDSLENGADQPYYLSLDW